MGKTNSFTEKNPVGDSLRGVNLLAIAVEGPPSDPKVAT